MAVGPSHPQTMPQTAMTAISTRRCLRLRVCRGSLSDSKYEPMEPTSTSLATGASLDRSVTSFGCRAEGCGDLKMMTESRISSRGPSRQTTQPAQLYAPTVEECPDEP